MAASVLSTPHAVEVSVFVTRAFVKMREMLGPHREAARRLDDLERRVGAHDESLRALVAAIRELMLPSARPKGRIGFQNGPAKGGGLPKALRAPRASIPRS